MWLLADVEVAKIVFLSALVLASGGLLLRTYRQTRRMTRPDGASSSARLDGKIEVLQRLMHDADQKIARLEALNERAARLTAGGPSSSLVPHAFAHQADAEVPRRPAVRSQGSCGT